MHTKDDGKKLKKKKFVVFLEKYYEKSLTLVLKHRLIFVSLFLIVFAMAILGVKFFVKGEAFPQEAADGFNIQFRLDKGASFDKTLEVSKAIESTIIKLPKNELVGFSTRMGTLSSNKNLERGSQHNLGIIFVYLTSYSERNQTAHEIIEKMRLQFTKNKKLTKDATITIELSPIGPPLGKAFEIQVITNDESLRVSKVKEIESYLKNLEGVIEIDNDDIEGKDELDIKINHKTLQQAGLTIEDVLKTLRIAFDGQIVTDLVTPEQTVDFRLRLNEKGRADINFIKNLPIQNKVGNLINLGQFVSANTQPSKSDIKHVNNKRTTTIFGNIVKDKINGNEVIALVRKKFPDSDTVKIGFAGVPVESAKIFGNLGLAALIAILGVYIILSLVFNSFIEPIIIILAIPLGLTGIVFAAITHGAPMSMFAGIAMVGLTGVIVNDAIVMVHTIKENTIDKMNNSTLVAGAVGRLRPILLTTATTVLGVMPTAYGIGGMDPFISQMCLFLGYGLLFGTFIVLFYIPLLFSITTQIQEIFQKNK